MRSVNKTPMIHDRHLVKKWLEAILQRDDYKNAFKMPENLTIATCRNKGPMTERMIDSLEGWDKISVLEKSLEYLGIDGLVILTDDRLPWRNTFKFEMLYNYLNSNECTTEYFMCCDAVDVIFKVFSRLYKHVLAHLVLFSSVNSTFKTINRKLHKTLIRML